MTASAARPSRCNPGIVQAAARPSPSPSAERASADASASVRPFGRLLLRGLIGKSDATMTWLAWDPQEQVERLLCLPRSQPRSSADAAAWHRAVHRGLRLGHPGLASAFEVDTQDGWPYVAYDRPAGARTLAERLQHSSRPPGPEEAVDWTCQLLEALAFAHEAGCVHGDLQLHHVCLDEDGRVSLIGLQVALSASADPSTGPMTEGSASALRLQREGAARDLLMVGVMLHRLVGASAPLDETDAARVVQRLPPLGREVLRLPWQTPHTVPEALRVIVNRSTDRQPAHRYFTARSVWRALDGWRQSAAKAGGGVLGLMLDRLNAAGHLPARADVLARVGRVSGMTHTHGRELAGALLLDLGLAFEVLRLVNGPAARGSSLANGESVLTLRRAVAMIGTAGVQRAAAALRPWPGPLDERQAMALARAIDQARVAAGTAVRLRPAGYDGEVVYLLTLLQNLGRLLLRYHFPDEARQIGVLMQPTPAQEDEPGGEGMSEREAEQAVLGLDTESLALAVARHWGLGDEVLAMLRRIPADKAVHVGTSDAELLRVAACAGNEAVEALLGADPARVGRQVARVVQRYGRLLRFNQKDLQEALQGAREAVRQGRVDVDFDLTRPAPLDL